MRAVLYIAVGAALLAAGTAEAQQRPVRHNAASGHARQVHVERGPMAESRVQTWYSDTGWQGGFGPAEAYGYGYDGAGYRPPVVAVPAQAPIRHGGYSGATRSMPFGYPVDGYGRYPWSRGGYGQGRYPQPVYASQTPIYVESPPIYIQPTPVYVEPPRVHVAPPEVHFEQGYFAMPDAPPPPPHHRSPTERPYTPHPQEPGERG